MIWNVKVHRDAVKQLEAIPPDRRKRIFRAIDELAADPFRGLVTQEARRKSGQYPQTSGNASGKWYLSALSQGPPLLSGFSKAGLDPESKKYGLGSSTAREMVTLLERIEKGEIVSPEASAEILKILKRQRDTNGIARRMGETVVANKSGALDHLRSDVGIVYSKGNRIAMAITCEDVPKIDWTPDNEGLLLIAKIAEILVADLK